MNNIRIRTARPEDAIELLEIYAPYVRETAVTYEYTVPSKEEFASRIRHTMEKYPYLVAEKDGEILGYAYAGAFHPRAAYAWDAEMSIYIKKDRKRSGIGKTLYEALEKLLAEQNILNVYACIACPEEEDEYLTKDSIRFHERMGYRIVGEFRECAYKFGRWYGMVWMEKRIGKRTADPAEVKSFDKSYQVESGIWKKKLEKN